MQTEAILKALKLTAKLMELHEENPFKVKAIANAAFRLDKGNADLEGKSIEELGKIEGIGKGIAVKINELNATGGLQELNKFLEITPPGVVDMMNVKGIGPKKVRQLWKELEIESVGELFYACNENRLVELKGFGIKTQEQVKKFIEFSLASKGKYHYAKAEETALKLVEVLKKKLNTSYVSLTGAIRRKCEIIEKIEILAAAESEIKTDEFITGETIPIEIITCSEKDFTLKLLETTGSAEHVKKLEVRSQKSEVESENEIYTSLGMQYIEPELREGLDEIELAKQSKIPRLIEVADLKGILHNHTTYSDGTHTLREMAGYCKELGYEYLGICDHSQSAIYANGLKPDRIRVQQAEIELLNKELVPFKIFKGVESDILNDGSLDYHEEILKTFDFIVASVHSNLKMNLEKATARLIKAIENPYTTILGHPTGRLLLSREGYPIDHKKVIDACAANNVVIELNANPYRLDIDWRWIPYCIEKGIMISINPDAHSKNGFHDMHYGVCVARKGMLSGKMCLNALSLNEIEKLFSLKNPRPN